MSEAPASFQQRASTRFVRRPKMLLNPMDVLDGPSSTWEPGYKNRHARSPVQLVWATRWKTSSLERLIASGRCSRGPRSLYGSLLVLRWCYVYRNSIQNGDVGTWSAGPYEHAFWVFKAASSFVARQSRSRKPVGLSHATHRSHLFCRLI